MGALFWGAGIAFCEYLGETWTWDVWTAVLIAAGAVWLVWSAVFILITFSVDPERLGMKLHRWLIAGSVLELLVAVPAHIVVRRRSDCCAGLETGIGICVGVAIMIVSFGPAVFLLCYRRGRMLTGAANR
jgi:hypothetical protein